MMHLFICQKNVRMLTSLVRIIFLFDNRLADNLGPRAIVMTAVSGLIGGWAIIMVIVYTVKDIPVRTSKSDVHLYGLTWG